MEPEGLAFDLVQSETVLPSNRFIGDGFGNRFAGKQLLVFAVGEEDLNRSAGTDVSTDA